MFEKFKKRVGDLVDKVKTKASEIKDNSDKQQKLLKEQNAFTNALSKYNMESTMNERELLYLGTRDVDKNVNKEKSPTKKANNVVNIIYEFIESQVDSNIPLPSVRSKLRGFEEQAATIEDSLKSDLLESDIYRINDENERTTPIQGFSLIFVNWNPDFKHHLYRGEIELDNRHPKCFIPQPGTNDIQKMQEFWIMTSESKKFVKMRYGVDVEYESEQFPNLNAIDGTGDNSQDETENVTIITKWYKDLETGKIGKYTWCNDITLEDMPDYFARRVHKCQQCGKVVYEDEKKCPDCNGKIKEVTEEYETLEYDVTRSDGTIIPAMSPVYDEYGMPEMEEVTDEFGNPMFDMMEQPITQPKMQPTKIKYFCPTRYPVVMRKNVPIAFNFGGQSDVDVIRDQADAIKKVVTKIEAKIIDGGAIVKLPKEPSVKISDEIYKVVRGTSAELQQIGVENIQADIQQDIVFAQQQYKSAQSTLGITDSFQGKPDPTATSGYAKKLSITQASGRMQSKAFNKRRAYKELFEIMFEFKLAFYDEIRPFLAKDEFGKDVQKEFNKYDFVVQDESGEYFYNTDFLFDADMNGAMLNDKLWIQEQAMAMYNAKAIDNIMLFTVLESINFPMAKQLKKQLEQQKQEQAQMMIQQQAQLGGVINGQMPNMPT